jgi:hypothetical protein
VEVVISGHIKWWVYSADFASNPELNQVTCHCCEGCVDTSATNISQDWLPGGEWGFVACTSSGAITAPFNLSLSPSDISDRLNNASSQRDSLMRATVSAHVSYWDRTSPGTNFEHWRFENGWKVGFSDAYAFFGTRTGKGLSSQGGDKIGCLEIWVLKRVRECGMRGGFVWEFEQGLRAGIRDFYQVVGI